MIRKMVLSHGILISSEKITTLHEPVLLQKMSLETFLVCPPRHFHLKNIKVIVNNISIKQAKFHLKIRKQTCKALEERSHLQNNSHT